MVQKTRVLKRKAKVLEKPATQMVRKASSDTKHPQYHLVPDKEKKWIIRKADAEKIMMHASTKDDLLKKASDYIKNHGGGSLRIHKLDGTIQEERSYGFNSRSSKG
ncbi:MAG: DUF2188 domain-containing protein [Caldisericales bacterium]|nr:DUF2188 domain-containing protein [Caldisericales bacterium]